MQDMVLKSSREEGDVVVKVQSWKLLLLLAMGAPLELQNRSAAIVVINMPIMFRVEFFFFFY